MLWLIVVASVAGFLLGVCLRVPAVIVASAAIVLTSLVVMPFGQWSLIGGTMFTVALLCSLQGGYLVGAAVLLSSSTRSRSTRTTADLPF